MIWLGIDTSNMPLSVALVQDGSVLVEMNAAMPVNHSLRAMPAIEEVFTIAGLSPNQIDAIAVSEGPGSYTGVRIGVTIAKTLAWTLQKPLVGVSSLQVLAANHRHVHGIICPIIDARRGNVYAAVYRVRNGQLEPVVADGHFAFDDLLSTLQSLQEPILFVGSDLALFAEQIEATFGESTQRALPHESLPRASILIQLAEAQQADDVHRFVPEYRRIAEAEANWLKQQRKDG